MDRRIEKAICAVGLVLELGISAGTQLSQTPSTRPEAGWYWYSGCREYKRMEMEILLDSKPIHRSSFRICRIRSADAPPLKRSPEVAFSFRGGHVFQGEHRTNATEMVEANVWQAGVEPDGLLLGVSFSSGHRVLLNTVHLARPDAISESKLDSSLLIKTYPGRCSRP